MIIFIQVPIKQFLGYVSKLVEELYDAVEAVVNGRLEGRGDVPWPWEHLSSARFCSASYHWITR